MAARNRISAIAGASLAAGMTLGLGVSPAQAETAPASPPPSSQPRATGTNPPQLTQVSDGQDLYQACPPSTDPNQFGACIFGINGAQQFTGPNQLGPSAPYTLANRNNQWTFGCIDNNPFPLTFPAQGTQVSIFSEFYGCGNGGNKIIARAEWNPPAPLPKGDIAAIHYNNQYQGSWVFPSFWCASSKYTQCDVIRTAQSNRPTTELMQFFQNFVYQIRNFPLIVEINNNLPAADNDDLIMDGAPEVSQFVLDPKGGNPTTIKAGESGYFGLYAGTATAPDKQSFSVTYNVSPSSTDIAGTSISLNAVIDPKTGTLDQQSSTCAFNVAVQNQPGTCDLYLLGGPRATQTLVVNIYE